MRDDTVGKSPAPTEVLVCVKCRKSQEIPADERRPGAAFYDAVCALDLPGGVTITPVECLANCSNGCTLALRGQGRWSYIYGGFDESADTDLLAQGIALYHATDDGLIPWRERPEHFKRNCAARIPPPTPTPTSTSTSKVSS